MLLLAQLSGGSAGPCHRPWRPARPGHSRSSSHRQRNQFLPHLV